MILSLGAAASSHAVNIDTVCGYDWNGTRYEWVESDFPSDQFRFLNESGDAVLFLPGNFAQYHFVGDGDSRSVPIVSASTFAFEADVAPVVRTELMNDAGEVFGEVVLFRNPTDPNQSLEEVSTTFAWRWTRADGFQDLASLVGGVFGRSDVGTETRIIRRDDGQWVIQTIDHRTTPILVNELPFPYAVDDQEQADAFAADVLDAIADQCGASPADRTASTAYTNAGDEFAAGNQLLRIAKPRINVQLSHDWLIVTDSGDISFESNREGTIGDQIAFIFDLYNIGVVDAEELTVSVELTGTDVLDPCCSQEFPTRLAVNEFVEDRIKWFDAMREGRFTAVGVVTGRDANGQAFESRSRALNLEVRPALDVVIDLPDRPLRLTEEVTPVVRVTSNLGQTASVAFDGNILSTFDADVFAVSDAANPGAFELAPGASRSFTIGGDPVAVGNTRVTTSITGTANDGRVFADADDHPISITESELQVSMRVLPQPFTLTLNDTNDIVTIFATIRNGGDQRITGVHIEGDEDGLTLTNPDLNEGVPLEAIGFSTPPTYPADLEPDQSMEVSWEYRALDAAAGITARVAATGVRNNENISSLGETTFKINTDVVAKWGVKRSGTTLPLSGVPVRVEGYVENITEDVAIGIVLHPITQGNAGRGILYDASLGIPRSIGLSSCSPTRRQTDLTHLYEPSTGQTDVARAFVLKPGESVELTAIVATMCWDQISEGSVTYVPVAKSLEMDEHGNIIRDLAGMPNVLADVSDQLEVGAERTVDDSTTTGYDKTVSFRLLDNEPIPDDFSYDCGTKIANLTCDALDAVAVWFEGLLGMPAFVLDVASQDLSYGKRFAAHVLAVFGEWGKLAVTLEGQTLRQSVRDELKLDVSSLLGAGVITLGQAEGALTKAAEQYANFVRDVDNQDFNALRRFTYASATVAPDVLLETGLLKAYAAKAKRGIATREAAEEAEHVLRRRAARLEEGRAEDVVDARYESLSVEKNIPREVAEIGDRLSYEAILRYWGAGTQRTIEKLEEIARRFNVRLGFRSRDIRGVQLLDDGLAYNKLEVMKMKSMKRLDVTDLDCPATRLHPEVGEIPSEAIVRLVEPPVTLAGRTEAEFSAALDDWMARRRPDLNPGSEAYDKLRSHAQLRAEEWALYNKPEYLPDWAANGVPVAFNYVAQGIPRVVESLLNYGRAKRRPLRLTESTFVDSLGSTRRIIDIDVDGPLGFRVLTGDLDFVHILNLDGTFILNPFKRIAIYLELQKVPGIQHGESMAFSLDNFQRQSYAGTSRRQRYRYGSHRRHLAGRSCRFQVRTQSRAVRRPDERCGAAGPHGQLPVPRRRGAGAEIRQRRVQPAGTAKLDGIDRGIPECRAERGVSGAALAGRGGRSGCGGRLRRILTPGAGAHTAPRRQWRARTLG
ncbi:MAG: hypothetical protein R3E84_05010 [Pseudomonadales bacterium]